MPQVANKALRAMLNDDSKAIASFKEELNEMGEYLAKEGNQQALTFCYTLLMLCDHVMCKESLGLEVREQDHRVQGVGIRAWELQSAGSDILLHAPHAVRPRAVQRVAGSGSGNTLIK